MRAVTIRDAKAHLNALVEAAERGEQVILMRGSKHVAAIVPLSEEDLELRPQITDPQAERLWNRLEAERQEGSSVVLESAEKAVEYLQSGRPSRARRGTSSVKKKRPQRRRQ
jgi:prevent-host-death family protein